MKLIIHPTTLENYLKINMLIELAIAGFEEKDIDIELVEETYNNQRQ